MYLNVSILTNCFRLNLWVDFECCWFHLTSVHNILVAGKLLENINLGFDKLHFDGKELVVIEILVVKL